MSQLGSVSPDAIADEFRSRGHRWTPQRRLILDVLSGSTGHVTGSDLVERCRVRDSNTTASTVYRTLDVFEELGYVSHSHSANGREEFHLLPHEEHGHVECRTCGRSWEIDPVLALEIAEPARARLGFAVDVGHTTLVGQCADCIASNRE
ncbi:MAG: Fur family transcriptional regulator [Candidatus Limnocylindrales bacterium]